MSLSHLALLIAKHKWEPVEANPSCLQATFASVTPQRSSHTVPQTLLLQISTRPWLEFEFLVLRSRMSPWTQPTEQISIKQPLLTFLLLNIFSSSHTVMVLLWFAHTEQINRIYLIHSSLITPGIYFENISIPFHISRLRNLGIVQLLHETLPILLEQPISPLILRWQNIEKLNKTNNWYCDLSAMIRRGVWVFESLFKMPTSERQGYKKIM